METQENGNEEPKIENQSLQKEEDFKSNNNNKTSESQNGWAIIFWIVTILAVIQYFAVAIPRFQRLGVSGFAAYFGGFLPNLVVILIFFFIKKGTDKKNKQQES